MFEKFINIKIFLLSFVIGIAIVYFYADDKKVVYVYPNPSNINNIQYKDKAENCYSFTQIKIKCPDDKSKINTIPIQ